MAQSKSFLQRITYKLTQLSARLAGVIWFQLRCEGRDQIPMSGGVLVCSNHQSYLDPVLIGLACDRRLNYLARDTLFDSKMLGWLIRWYDAIPIQRDGFGLSGIKETLKRLKREEMVLIFPEGTRTLSGQIGPLKPGFCSLARRGTVALLPVAIAGAFEAWPRGQRLPGRSQIHIQFGSPISPEEIAKLSDDQLVKCLQTRISNCFQQAQNRQTGEFQSYQ
ncbi:MAG: lysophospholipid acyltransferase family protein [Pirellulaceae bacterium]|nr:lysophospholipid acyltransferase family protein [Pirellulaceae bacterium]